MVKRKREEVKNAAGAQKGKSARFEEGAVTKSKSASEKSKNQSDTKSKSKSKGKSDKVAGVPKPSSKSVAIGESPAALSVHTKAATEQISVQIVTGSYERVLHGFAASIPGNLVPNASSSKDDGEGEEAEKKLSVSDTFLFAAHSSALRCLAVSPSTESHKRILATGSTDERINLFSLSTSPPAASSKPQLPTLSQTNVLENSRNRELGSLLHHTRSINKLQFPTRGKLFSSADDNTIAISRTRDWTVLSTIKVPVPKAVGRPSGDTAGPGEVPTGVNDFAIHPSMKVMVSVAKGERSMRLWNLVTGKKAGVLNFDKDLLQAVGEGRYSSGEGRKVLWTEDGEEFVIGFERGAVIYGMDSVPKATIRPSPPTKVHQMRFLPATHVEEGQSILAVSTEDGRILFYDTRKIVPPSGKQKQQYAVCQAIAQLGGLAAGFTGRVKDFEILSVPSSEQPTSSPLLIITGSSDGAVRVWRFSASEMQSATKAKLESSDETEQAANAATQFPQVGSLIGTHETGHRITCLVAFQLDGPPEQGSEEVAGDEAVSGVEGSDSDSDSE